MIKQIKKLNIPGIAFGIIFLVILFTILNPKFFSTYNFILILRNTCTLLLASTGMTWVILISQIDLSIGSVVSASAVLVAILNNAGFPVVLTIACAMAMGTMVGLINGVLISHFKFDYWVVTFSTMSIMAGLALVIANGETIGTNSQILDLIGNGEFFGLYYVIVIVAAITGVMIWMQKNTVLGYNIFSIGGSENVASVSGIKVTKTRIIVYMVSGMFASLTGVIIACMTNSGSPTVGGEYTFDAIAAVVIGGSSFDGGKGGLSGTIFGALLLRVLASGLSIVGMPSTWQKAIIGLIIVSLIVADVLNEKRKSTFGLRRVYNDVK